MCAPEGSLVVCASYRHECAKLSYACVRDDSTPERADRHLPAARDANLSMQAMAAFEPDLEQAVLHAAPASLLSLIQHLPPHLHQALITSRLSGPLHPASTAVEQHSCDHDSSEQHGGGALRTDLAVHHKTLTLADSKDVFPGDVQLAIRELLAPLVTHPAHTEIQALSLAGVQCNVAAAVELAECLRLLPHLRALRVSDAGLTGRSVQRDHRRASKPATSARP